MTRRGHHLARHVDEDQIAGAIKTSEAGTTGRILVVLSAHEGGDVRRTGERAFERLGLHRAPDRNNVLFFVVPSKREFAILGDAGVHQKVGQEFWDALAASVGKRIREEDLTRGLIHGIQEVARELERHFPKES